MDHLARIQKAIDFIEHHLRDELSTEAIAKVAAFSTWHFQKIFAAVVGDSVKSYVRKRRLASALIDLVRDERRLIEVAIDYRFESQESFTRAFKAAFGLTPGAVRKMGTTCLPPPQPRITMAYLDHLFGGLTMVPQIKTVNETIVVGLGTQFISILSPDKNNEVVLPKLWRSYKERSREIKHRVGRRDVGLCAVIADPAQKSHPDAMFYMAGTEVSDASDLPPGMMAKVVPAGRYAVFTHKGFLSTLVHTMNYIYGSWLPKSGEEPRDAPDLEIYDERFRHSSDDAEIDIYVPIK